MALFIVVNNEFNRDFCPELVNKILKQKEVPDYGVNVRELTHNECNIRMHIRNFMLTHTFDELHTELQIAFDKNDLFRCACIKELLNEQKQSQKGL